MIWFWPTHLIFQLEIAHSHVMWQIMTHHLPCLPAQMVLLPMPNYCRKFQQAYSGGRLFLEIGAEQTNAVKKLAEQAVCSFMRSLDLVAKTDV